MQEWSLFPSLQTSKGDWYWGKEWMGKFEAKFNLEWPKIPCPPKKSWDDFRWCIRKAFRKKTNPGRLSSPVTLGTDLGPWLAWELHILHDHYRCKSNTYTSYGCNFLQYNKGANDNYFRVNGTMPITTHPVTATFDIGDLWSNVTTNGATQHLAIEGDLMGWLTRIWSGPKCQMHLRTFAQSVWIRYALVNTLLKLIFCPPLHPKILWCISSA